MTTETRKLFDDAKHALDVYKNPNIKEFTEVLEAILTALGYNALE